MSRYFFYALVLAFVVWVVLLGRTANGDPIPPRPDTSPIPAPPSAALSLPDPEPVHTLELAALKRQVRLEHRRYLQAHRRVRTLTRTLAHHTSTREAIQLACVVYGYCDTLWRRARCESGLSPTARNPSGAAGLLQFLPSTFASTPFGAFSIWSPYANALAAGWMITHGRGNEWSCK